MARYIDADLFLERMKRTSRYFDVKFDVEEIPTANVVPLPCKVGDEVWAIRQYRHIKIPVKGKVSEMYYIDESMTLCIVVKGVCRGEWGKAVFPTYEAAESYLGGAKC